LYRLLYAGRDHQCRCRCHCGCHRYGSL